MQRVCTPNRDGLARNRIRTVPRWLAHWYPGDTTNPTTDTIVLFQPKTVPYDTFHLPAYNITALLAIGSFVFMIMMVFSTLVCVSFLFLLFRDIEDVC